MKQYDAQGSSIMHNEALWCTIKHYDARRNIMIGNTHTFILRNLPTQ